MKKTTLLFLLILLIIAGCSAPDLQIDDPQPPTVDSTSTPEATTPAPAEIDPALPDVTLDLIPTDSKGESPMPPPIEPVPGGPTPGDITERAIQDLAERLSVTPSEITLVEAREVTWANGALGCPQPGMMYADVLTPGYLIILRVGSADFEYHASKGTELVYCKNPEPPASGIDPDI